MKRVMVIGCPGSGKSTLSRELHKITGLPLFCLDMMYWNPDRTKVDKAVFRKSLFDVLLTDEWIIDGNYGSTMEQRMQVCDTVIFLDYPLRVCLDGVLERRGKERPDMPWVERANEIDVVFLDFIKSFNAESRPNIIELLEKYSYKNVIILKSRDEADEFLKRL